MKKLVMLITCLLISALAAGPAFSQMSYCKDFLEPGNAGGWSGSLKTFEDVWSLSPGESIDLDIWINDLPETLVTTGFFITYDPALINIVSVMPYKTGNSGPWEFATSFELEPGKWFLALGNFDCVSPDTNGDIIIGKVTFECQAIGDTVVTIQTIPGFDTTQGCSGRTYDPQISPSSITIRQEPLVPDDSCQERCTLQAPAGCWCDSACEQFGDCCPDKCNWCTDDPACRPLSCEGRPCVYDSAEGCQCDPACEQYGDCCPDKCDWCTDDPACRPLSCEGRSCVYDSSEGCQCDPACEQFGDCCPDKCDWCTDDPAC